MVFGSMMPIDQMILVLTFGKGELLWWRKVKKNAESPMMFILQVSKKFFS